NWAMPRAPTGETAFGFQLDSCWIWAAMRLVGICAVLAAFSTASLYSAGIDTAWPFMPLSHEMGASNLLRSSSTPGKNQPMVAITTITMATIATTVSSTGDELAMALTAVTAARIAWATAAVAREIAIDPRLICEPTCVAA